MGSRFLFFKMLKIWDKLEEYQHQAFIKEFYTLMLKNESNFEALIEKRHYGPFIETSCDCIDGYEIVETYSMLEEHDVFDLRDNDSESAYYYPKVYRDCISRLYERCEWKASYGGVRVRPNAIIGLDVKWVPIENYMMLVVTGTPVYVEETEKIKKLNSEVCSFIDLINTKINELEEQNEKRIKELEEQNEKHIKELEEQNEKRLKEEREKADLIRKKQTELIKQLLGEDSVENKKIIDIIIKIMIKNGGKISGIELAKYRGLDFSEGKKALDMLVNKGIIFVNDMSLYEIKNEHIDILKEAYK